MTACCSKERLKKLWTLNSTKGVTFLNLRSQYPVLESHPFVKFLFLIFHSHFQSGKIQSFSNESWSKCGVDFIRLIVLVACLLY